MYRALNDVIYVLGYDLNLIASQMHLIQDIHWLEAATLFVMLLPLS